MWLVHDIKKCLGSRIEDRTRATSRYGGAGYDRFHDQRIHTYGNRFGFAYEQQEDLIGCKSEQGCHRSLISR